MDVPHNQIQNFKKWINYMPSFSYLYLEGWTGSAQAKPAGIPIKNYMIKYAHKSETIKAYLLSKPKNCIIWSFILLDRTDDVYPNDFDPRFHFSTEYGKWKVHANGPNGALGCQPLTKIPRIAIQNNSPNLRSNYFLFQSKARFEISSFGYILV